MLICQLLFIPVLDGKALLYSFVSTPEVRLGVAFGSGGSQSLPATELPGVSSWLVGFLANYFFTRIKFILDFFCFITSVEMVSSKFMKDHVPLMYQ